MESIIRFISINPEWSILSSEPESWMFNAMSFWVGIIILIFFVIFYIRDISSLFDGDVHWIVIYSPAFIQVLLLWGIVQVPFYWGWLIGVPVEALYLIFIFNESLWYEVLSAIEERNKYKRQIEHYRETHRQIKNYINDTSY